MKVQSGGRIKVRARKVIIALVSMLAVIGFTIGLSDANEVKARTTSEDIEQFPETYKEALYALKEKHPNWTFEVMNTGLSWSEVVYNEMNPSNRSLVPTYFDSKFVGAYYGDGWACATQEAVEYYLDPRNWLTEDYIFQFEKLTYNGNTQGIATVQKVLQNTFMSGFIQNDSQFNYEQMGLTYAQSFRDIGEYIGVSPVHLATRVKQEQGTQGTSDLISGVYPGYEGYYNYYNIQASGKTHEEIVANGLNEAKAEGWNSRYAALLGGSKKVAERYILRGQDTLYLQKFDVDGQYDGRYWHQYMQNLAAPSNEGRNIKKAYASAGLLDETFVFKIPVYLGMPNQNGFVNIDGKVFYYQDGALLKGSYRIDDAWYYFDTTTGQMIQNQFIEIDGKQYYYAGTGKRAVGQIVYLNTYWYLCEKDTGEVTKSKYAGDVFNAEDYAKYYPDVVNALGTDATALLSHWLNCGIYEGRRPSELYSYDYYANMYNGRTLEYGSAYESVIGHFALLGMYNGYSGSEEFNVLAYMMCNEDLFMSIGINLEGYYEYYMNTRSSENRIHTASLEAYNSYFMGTVLFDPDVYTNRNEDINAAIGNDVNSLFAHWVKNGVYEGRCASHVYDGRYYLETYSDINSYYKGEYVWAMLHFYLSGMAEFRNGSSEFDVLGYVMSYTDLFYAFGEDGASYYRHYCTLGIQENRVAVNTDKISRIFDAKYYLNAYPDVSAVYPHEYGAERHFAFYGIREGRRGNTSFDVYAYKERYKDLQDLYGEDMYMYYMHYMNCGYDEGRIG